MFRFLKKKLRIFEEKLEEELEAELKKELEKEEKHSTEEKETKKRSDREDVHDMKVEREKQIDKQVNTIIQNNNVDISNVYKKGWFASSAETTFDLSQILNQYTKLNTNIIQINL